MAGTFTLTDIEYSRAGMCTLTDIKNSRAGACSPAVFVIVAPHDVSTL